MSISPRGTGPSRSFSIKARRRLAIRAPRVWMPTIAIGSWPFRSTISWAMRTSVRCKSSRSRTAWVTTCSFLASRDRVKGTDGASVSAAPEGSIARGGGLLDLVSLAIVTPPHQLRRAPFAVGNLDQVEVARHDRVLEGGTRLLLDHGREVARRQVRKSEE